MKRCLVLAMILCCAATLCAETTILRVRLMSTRRVERLQVRPRAKTSMAFGEGARVEVVGQSLDVRASGDRVMLGSRAAKRMFLAGDYDLDGADGAGIHARFFSAIAARNGELILVGSVALEDYVAAAVQGESAGAMPAEALKALAIAARSYAVKTRARGEYELVDSTADQHLNFDVSASSRSAAQATAGEMLWVKGRLLTAYHHASCGGRTEAAAALWPDEASPALTSHEDVYCPRRTQPWRTQLSRAQVDEALRAASVVLPKGWLSLRVSERDASGRARLLMADGARLSASTLRTALGRAKGWATLKSDLYELTQHGDQFIFIGRGLGHGVGLCQTGAAEMAAEGRSQREILAYYYPGALVGKNAQGMAWLEDKLERWTLRAMNAADLQRLRVEVDAASREVEARSGLTIARTTIELYDDTAIFRDATGEPGWAAASTRGDRVSLQPSKILGARLHATLRHELTHRAIEGAAAEGEPLWWREGLALVWSEEPLSASPRRMTKQEVNAAIAGRRTQAAQRAAYAEAQRMALELEKKYGRAQLLQWLRHGLPKDIALN